MGPLSHFYSGWVTLLCYFVDDFSQHIWIYLFKNRSELYQIYRDFTKMIETLFSKPIKVLRFDNAQEYKAHEFSSILNLKNNNNK